MKLVDYDFPAFQMLQVSETEYQEREEKRAKNIYEDIIEPALEESFDSRTIFQPDSIQDEIRPPYSYGEIKDALQYGAENRESLQLQEADMDLYLVQEK